MYRVHALSRVPCACVLGIQQIETCAVAEIAKPGTHLYIYHFTREKKKDSVGFVAKISSQTAGYKLSSVKQDYWATNLEKKIK